MADIALLVAEEYERRMKKARKEGTVVVADDGGIGFFSGLSVSAKRVDLEGGIGDYMMTKMEKGEKKLDLMTRVLEPRTEIGDAASNCFFSS